MTTTWSKRDLAAGLEQERDLGDGDVGSLLGEPVGGRGPDPRMELGLEPGELGAVGEHDPADRRAIDLAVAEDALAPALAQRRLQLLVLAIEAVDDVVGRDGRRRRDARTPAVPRSSPPRCRP